MSTGTTGTGGTGTVTTGVKMTTPFFSAKKVKTVFGDYDIAEDSVSVKLSKTDSEYDYVLRDPQYKSIQYEIEQVANNSNIMMDPKQYLKDKNVDIIRIANELKISYKNDYIALLTQSYTQSQARKIALEQSKKRKEFLMDLHKKKFPKELSHLKDKL